MATIGQLTVLAPAAGPGDGAAPAAGGGGRPDDGPLCVVNTHLFFHPRAPHIRAMHAAALLAEAGAQVGDVAAAPALAGRRPALLFCGDLNSDLNDGVPGAALGGKHPRGFPPVVRHASHAGRCCAAHHAHTPLKKQRMLTQALAR